MIDREKVTKELEETEIMLTQAVDRGGEMAVMGAFKCLNRVKDSLALLKDDETQLQYRDDHIAMYQAEIKRLEAMLKEHEPKPVEYTNAYGTKFYFCPKCKRELFHTRNLNFCERCGQAVKWE
jgi:tRNA(Ile2) C34 agmatinyltransferase TiaS